MQENSQDYVVDSVKDGLLALSNDKTVFFGRMDQMYETYNKNPGEISNFAQFGNGRPTYSSLLLTKNSPLTPFFRKEALKSIQSGLRDALLQEWIGAKIKNGIKTEPFSVSMGQTFTVFLQMILFATLSTLVCGIEFILAKLSNYKNSKKPLAATETST